MAEGPCRSSQVLRFSTEGPGSSLSPTRARVLPLMPEPDPMPELPATPAWTQALRAMLGWTQALRATQA